VILLLVEALGLAAASALDLRSHRVPNLLVVPLLAIGALGPLALGWDATRNAWLGGLAAGLVMLALFLMRRGAMGFGDVKIAAYCGMVAGPGSVALMLLLAHALGALVAATALALRLRRRTDSMPLTPFLAAGLCVALVTSSRWP